MFEEIKEEKVYTCNYCGKSFETVELVKEHQETCLWNGSKQHNCITCKQACYKLAPVYAKDNGYDILRKQGITSNNSYFECSKDVYKGKLTEEKVLRTDKKCYEQRELATMFNIERSKEYDEYVNLLDEINKDDSEINNWINEFWGRVEDLSAEGKTEEEILKILEEEFKDEQI